VVVSTTPENLEALMSKAATSGVPATVIGRTGGSRIAVDLDGARAIDIAVDEAEAVWSSAIERYFG
jgi:phosphoribosylformylglycinamidine synthase